MSCPVQNEGPKIRGFLQHPCQFRPMVLVVVLGSEWATMKTEMVLHM